MGIWFQPYRGGWTSGAADTRGGAVIRGLIFLSSTKRAEYRQSANTADTPTTDCLGAHHPVCCIYGAVGRKPPSYTA